MILELKIDPEFASRIPPLTAEEYQQLEQNILEEGAIISPLIVWKGVIIDGHNRFRILQKHPEIRYTTYEKDFPSHDVATAWICRNQLGRRNLTPEQKKYLMGRQYESEKESIVFHGNQYTSLSESGAGQNVQHQKQEWTAERIARENHTNEKFVRRAGKYANGIDAADEVEPGIRQEIFSGEICPIDAAVQAVAQAPPEERPALARRLRDPDVQRRRKRQPKTEEERLIEQISADMEAPKGSVTEDNMLDTLHGVTNTMIRGCERCFGLFPTLLSEPVYRARVLEIMQEPKDYILNLENGGQMQ